MLIAGGARRNNSKMQLFITLLVLLFSTLSVASAAPFNFSVTTFGDDGDPATPQPYVISSINTWSYTVGNSQDQLNALRDGAVSAIHNQNVREGGIRGRNVSIAFGDFDLIGAIAGTGPRTALPIVQNITARFGSNLVAFVATALDVLLESVVPSVARYNMTLVGAVGRDPNLRKSFSPYLAHLLPSPEAELLTQVDYVVKTLRYRRIVLLINIFDDTPIENHPIYPVYLLLQKKLAEVGVRKEEVILFVIDMRVELAPSQTTWRLATALPALLAKRPQALFNAAPGTTTGAQLTAFLLLQLPSIYVGLFTVHGAMVEQMLAQLPAMRVGNRLTITLPLPLFSSSDKPIANAYRAEMQSAFQDGAVRMNISDDLSVGGGNRIGFKAQFAFISWVHAKFVLAVMLGVNPSLPITAQTFTDALFNFRVQPIGEMFFGMFGKDCRTFTGPTCQCNQGGKFLWMSSFDQSGSLHPIDSVLTTIPFDKCDLTSSDSSSSKILPNPILQIRAYPNYTYGTGNAILDAQKTDAGLSGAKLQKVAAAITAGARYRSVSAALQSSSTSSSFTFVSNLLPVPITTLYLERNFSAPSPTDVVFANAMANTVVCAYMNPILEGLDLYERDEESRSLVLESPTALTVSASNSTDSVVEPILLIDPIRLTPAPHNYAENVIRVTATLDQELYSAAALSFFGSEQELEVTVGGEVVSPLQSPSPVKPLSPMFLIVTYAMPAEIVDQIVSLAEKSMNTFGQRFLSGVIRGRTVGGALLSLPASARSTASTALIFILGMEPGARDAGAIVDFLSETEGSRGGGGPRVIIPHEHIVVCYDELRLALALGTDRLGGPSGSFASRLLASTSLGPWNTTFTNVTTSTAALPLLDAVEAAFVSGLVAASTSSSSASALFASISQTQRTPAALLGFVTEAFTSRVLLSSSSATSDTTITPSVLIKAIYSTAIVKLFGDDGLVLGPYSSDWCEDAISSSSSSCELCAGARSVSFVSFAVASGLVPLNASSDSSFPDGSASASMYAHNFDSARLTYIPLPPGPGPNIGAIVGGAVGGAVALILLLTIFSYFFASYLSTRHAPKDSSEPFALVFTDIQNSTGLWADMPDSMPRALADHHSIIRKLIRKHNGYEVKTVGDSFMVAFKRASDAVALAKDLQHAFLKHKWIGPASDEFEDEDGGGVDGRSNASLPSAVHIHLDEAIKGPRVENASPNDHLQPPALRKRLFFSDFDTAYREREWELEASDPTEHPKSCLSAFLPDEEYARLWNGLRVRVGVHFGVGDIILDPVSKRYDYYGSVANVAARVESCGHGGQSVITDAVLWGWYSELKSGGTCDASTLMKSVRRNEVMDIVKDLTSMLPPIKPADSQSSSLKYARAAQTNNNNPAEASGVLVATPLGEFILRGLSDPIFLLQLTTIVGRRYPPLRETGRPDGEPDLGSDKDDQFAKDASLSLAQSKAAVRSSDNGTAPASSTFGMSPAQDAFFSVGNQSSSIKGSHSHEDMTATVLGVLVAPFTAEGKKKLLSDACKHWQIRPEAIIEEAAARRRNLHKLNANDGETDKASLFSHQQSRFGRHRGKVDSKTQADQDAIVALADALASRITPIVNKKAERKRAEHTAHTLHTAVRNASSGGMAGEGANAAGDLHTARNTGAYNYPPASRSGSIGFTIGGSVVVAAAFASAAAGTGSPVISDGERRRGQAPTPHVATDDHPGYITPKIGSPQPEQLSPQSLKNMDRTS